MKTGSPSTSEASQSSLFFWEIIPKTPPKMYAYAYMYGNSKFSKDNALQTKQCVPKKNIHPGRFTAGT